MLIFKCWYKYFHAFFSLAKPLKQFLTEWKHWVTKILSEVQIKMQYHLGCTSYIFCLTYKICKTLKCSGTSQAKKSLPRLMVCAHSPKMVVIRRMILGLPKGMVRQIYFCIEFDTQGHKKVAYMCICTEE